MISTTPGLTSNDPRFQAAWAGWLEESRMALPAGLRLRVDLVDLLPALDDPRTAYRQGPVEIRAGAPLEWAHVAWPGLALARIEADRPAGEVFLTRKALADRERLFRGFLLVVLIFLWKRDRRFHIHAGLARDPTGRGWLLAGNTGSGKSTTMALLAARGWGIGTDDIGFLTRRGDRVEVCGLRDRIALRPGGASLLDQAGGLRLAGRGKTGFWPEELGGRWVPSIEPDLVVFTAGVGPRTRLAPATPREILASLIHNSAWVMFETTGAAEHLDLLARLGRQARCYHATLGPDLFTRPGALLGFLP
jgi:hypothetical protein